MGEFTVKLPGGREYKIEADDADAAFKKAATVAQQDISAKQQAQRDEMPMWAKPFGVAEDLAKTGIDAATLSTLPAAYDWMAGESNKETGTMAQDVTAARERLGSWAMPADIVGGIAGPGKLSLPLQAAKLGGGKLARGAIGLLAGTGQGAIEGGISAAAQGESIPGGLGVGALSGTLGTGASNVMAGAGNRAAKWWRGIDDTLPPPNPRASAVTPAGKVDRMVAETQALPGGGSQAQIRNAVNDIRTQKAFAKKPEVLEQMNTIVQGDPATKATKAIGNAANAATIPSSLLMGMGNVPAGLAAAVGLPAIGGAANYASKQGTQESLDELRRMLLNHPKYKGILSGRGKDKAEAGVRRMLMEELEQEQGY